MPNVRYTPTQMCEFLEAQAAEERKGSEYRRQSAVVWRSGDDESWADTKLASKMAGRDVPSVPKARRESNALADESIARRHDEKADKFKACVSALAEKDAQIAALRKSIADIQFVAAKARDTMPMGVYPRNQFKHLADFAFDALRETPAPPEPTPEKR